MKISLTGRTWLSGLLEQLSAATMRIPRTGSWTTFLGSPSLWEPSSYCILIASRPGWSFCQDSSYTTFSGSLEQRSWYRWQNPSKHLLRWCFPRNSSPKSFSLRCSASETLSFQVIHPFVPFSLLFTPAHSRSVSIVHNKGFSLLWPSDSTRAALRIRKTSQSHTFTHAFLLTAWACWPQWW